MADKIRILIVDDHPKMREIMIQILNKLGFDFVVACQEISAALNVLEYNSIDLVICDYHMKVDNGLVLHNEMKRNPQLRNINFILVTADDDLKPVVEAAKRGLHLLNKPYSPEQLSKAIANLYAA